MQMISSMSGTISSTQITKSKNHLSCFHQRTRSLPLTEEETAVETVFPSGASSSSSSMLHSFECGNQSHPMPTSSLTIYPKNSISSLSSMHSSSNSSITMAASNELNGSSILRKLCEAMCTLRNADGSRKHLATCCFYQLDKPCNKNHTHKPIKPNYPNNRSTINNNHIHTDAETGDSAYLLMTSSTMANRKGMNGSIDWMENKMRDTQIESKIATTTTTTFTNYTEICPFDTLILPSIIISAPNSSTTDHINQNLPSLTAFSSPSSVLSSSSTTLTPSALRCKGCNSLRSM